MERIIFTPSTSLMREPMLAISKAGFFYFRYEGDFTPIIRRPAITERLRSVPPAQVDLLTAVFGGPLLFFLPVTSTSPHMEIQTPQGMAILLDEEDYHLVKGFKWASKAEGSRFYAVTEKAPLRRMHRLIMKAKPGQVVDHINGNGLDNRKVNLRICTDQQNSFNRRKHSTNKTGFKGVSWSDTAKKFAAHIQINGKSKYLGYFESPFKAARAYDAAAREFHGEFANLNFPNESK